MPKGLGHIKDDSAAVTCHLSLKAAKQFPHSFPVTEVTAHGMMVLWLPWPAWIYQDS